MVVAAAVVVAATVIVSVSAYASVTVGLLMRWPMMEVRDQRRKGMSTAAAGTCPRQSGSGSWRLGEYCCCCCCCHTWTWTWTWTAVEAAPAGNEEVGSDVVGDENEEWNEGWEG